MRALAGSAGLKSSPARQSRDVDRASLLCVGGLLRRPAASRPGCCAPQPRPARPQLLCHPAHGAGGRSVSGAEVETLRERLQSVLAPADHAYLNDQLANPTDENLARWLRERLQLGDVRQIGIQSTTHCGVDLDNAGHAHVWRRYRFQAAHQLPNAPLATSAVACTGMASRSSCTPTATWASGIWPSTRPPRRALGAAAL